MPSRLVVRSTLLRLLEDEMGETYPELTDDQDLREGLGLDSVDVVGIVMRIEREFRIRLSQEELAEVKRVGDLLDLMEVKLGEREASD
jgi:acyl carrier protein